MAKKYFKRSLTYYEVSENGDYISVTPLISQTTVSAGNDFRKTDIETEITQAEFQSETTKALIFFWDRILGLQKLADKIRAGYEKTI
jgi:hypothetical protein